MAADACPNCQKKRMRGQPLCGYCGATFAKEAPAPELPPQLPAPDPGPATAPPTQEKPVVEEREYQKLFRA